MTPGDRRTLGTKPSMTFSDSGIRKTPSTRSRRAFSGPRMSDIISRARSTSGGDFGSNSSRTATFSEPQDDIMIPNHGWQRPLFEPGMERQPPATQDALDLENLNKRTTEQVNSLAHSSNKNNNNNHSVPHWQEARTQCRPELTNAPVQSQSNIAGSVGTQNMRPPVQSNPVVMPSIPTAGYHQLGARGPQGAAGASDIRQPSNRNQDTSLPRTTVPMFWRHSYTGSDTTRGEDHLRDHVYDHLRSEFGAVCTDIGGLLSLAYKITFLVRYNNGPNIDPRRVSIVTNIDHTANIASTASDDPLRELPSDSSVALIIHGEDGKAKENCMSFIFGNHMNIHKDATPEQVYQFHLWMLLDKLRTEVSILLNEAFHDHRDLDSLE